MSFIAKLKIDGEEMNVLHCGFPVSAQGTDTTGKPTAIPQGGQYKPGSGKYRWYRIVRLDDKPDSN